MNESDKDNLVRVTIYGQQYTVKGKADPSYITSVAEYVSDKMEEVENSLTSFQSPLRVAILAAMNITDEYFTSRKEKENILRTVDEKSKFLIELIDEQIEE
jgi:cell division protein ZapA